jgi:glycosyltransferase involved in cell wall biosynthesis
MFVKNTSLIIPTRNRVKFITRILVQLKLLKLNFHEILVVDSSDKQISILIKKICNKYNVKYYHTKPSTSYQRNYGLKKRKKNHFVMFLDDDIIFLKKAFIEMNQVISKYQNNINVVGFGFNLIEKKNYNFFDKFKNSFFFEKVLPLYSKQPGKVLPNGWHTPILNLKKDVYVDWIYSGASIFKSFFIKNIKFDNTFGKYSYLEDLDFSLNLKKNNKKIIVAHLAKFINPNFVDRNNFKFGIIEIVNRFKIVKKNNLNAKLFFLSAFLRFTFSIFQALKLNYNYLLRAMGNLVGIFKCLFFL